MNRRLPRHRFERNFRAPLALQIAMGIGGILLFFFFLFYLLGNRFIPYSRYSVVILGDPLEVVSVDSDHSDLVTIRFPKDTIVRGMSGLGNYRLDALWSVAATDASPSSIVLESLTDELGVPLERYIAVKGSIWEKRKTDGPLYPRIFSFLHIVTFLRGGFETNISFGEYLGLLRIFSSIHQSHVTERELTPKYGLVEQIGPDGIANSVFDRNLFDRATGDLFQDTAIRQEGMRVAVLNTTGKERLGLRVSRIVGKLGAHVVEVGNDANLADSCELVGKKAALESKTAVVLRQIFGCTQRFTQEETVADIVLRVGKAYAEKYAPKR